MAVYKVPQDVEADDKLLGPFSFRQFIYLIIVCVACIIAWALGSLFIPLGVIPLPVILFFGALALPLKKDQPMETYVAALISFYTKPRKRLWEPDGLVSVMEITESKEPEIIRVKDLTQSEAIKRLGYLADIADSEGWSVRNISKPTGSSLQGDILLEANSTEDTLDESNNIARSFNQMITQSDAARKQEAMNRMYQQTPVTMNTPPNTQEVETFTQNNIPQSTQELSATMQNNTLQNTPLTTNQTQGINTVTPNNPSIAINPTLPQVAQTPIAPAITPSINQSSSPDSTVNYNPYPTMRQSVIQPSSQSQPQAQPQSIATQNTEDTEVDKEVVSPDILNLVNNSDLSVETIAHEADRIKKKEEEAKDMSEEVVISLH